MPCVLYVMSLYVFWFVVFEMKPPVPVVPVVPADGALVARGDLDRERGDLPWPPPPPPPPPSIAIVRTPTPRPAPAIVITIPLSIKIYAVGSNTPRFNIAASMVSGPPH